MPSTVKLKPLLWNFAYNWVCFFSMVPVSFAAEAMIKRNLGDDATNGFFWSSMAAAQLLILLGHAASSLQNWAGWIDEDQKQQLSNRLKLISGIAAAMLAGNIAFYGCYYYLLYDPIVAFIAAGVTGFTGDKLLNVLAEKFMTKVP